MNTAEILRSHQEYTSYLQQLQNDICSRTAELDGKETFSEQRWERPEGAHFKGGGGRSRILRGGRIFEQAGINFSEVYGTLPATMSEKLIGKARDSSFYATGVSLVIHPISPMVPSYHANIRYLEVEDKSWFGGGMDLTPHYLFTEDARYFHELLKSTCDKHNTRYYPEFKKACDNYFYLPHRGESRGIGGIFFDYLGRDEDTAEQYYPFVQDIGNIIADLYLPIVGQRIKEPWTKKEKDFQLIRRGRYVEFNLLYDRGTLFGLKTNGRTESILMSLPPNVRWEYDHQLELGSREAALVEVLKKPRDWAKL